MITATATRSPFAPSGATARGPRPAPATGPAATWSVIATLCAARQEADGGIRLVLSDPTGRPHRLIARIPGPESDILDSGLRPRMRAACHAFTRDVVEPPFEGFALLYGAARLTLTRSATNPAVPDVVDFTALDGSPRGAPCRRLPHG